MSPNPNWMKVKVSYELFKSQEIPLLNKTGLHLYPFYHELIRKSQLTKIKQDSG